MPVLIEHFREHRALNSGLSIGKFIVLHYFSGNPKDADYDRDMQLPFRAGDVILVSSTVVLPVQLELDFTPPAYGEKTYVLLGAEHLTPRHSASVFQPPKIC